ncbi:AMP-binding enzyme [Popillia japonica]|uniref:AMP-binding enzyme n=1 Tax=Popillia japonica TaxID=7064 RepID=A0AAW1LXV4_POPJA
MSLARKIVVNQVRRRVCSAHVMRRSYSSENKSDDFIRSKHPNIDIPKMHFAEFMFEQFQNFSERIALQCALTQRKYTYDDILVKSTHFSKGLRKKLKLQKGDVIALLLPNIPEFYICTFGSLLAGLKVTTINPLYTPDEIKRQLLDADVKAIITMIPLWQLAKASADLTKNNINIITVKSLPNESVPTGAINFQELVDLNPDIPDIELPSPDETVFIPYSSGTTGLPKGVELSSNNLVANISQVTQPKFKLVLPENTPQDVTIGLLPMFHVYGFTTMLALMKDGSKVLTLPEIYPR